MKIKVEESLLVGAPPAKVYVVLADPNHHKHILPAAFVSYKAESNNTVAYSLKIGGIKRDFRALLEQIEPNKLLRETELNSGIITEFRLEPHNDGTIVTITTCYETANTIAGFIEGICTPATLKSLYNEELVKLGRYILAANVSVSGDNE